MSPAPRINRPGAPANPPHTAREGTAISDYTPLEEGTAPPVADHDPHPSDEGHPYEGDRAAPPRHLDIHPNPAIHTGSPEPKPDNADHGPKFSPS